MSQFSFGPANEQIPNATTSASGLMSATDKTKLDGIGQSTMRDVPFAVAVADWTLSSGVYSAEFTSAYITASSKEIATYEANYRDYAKASISIDKKSGGGGMIFTTSVIPTGTITGHLYVWDNDDSKVPVLIEDTVVSIANGGTGQSSLAGVKSAFGIDALNTHLTNYLNAVTQNLSYNYPTIEIISGTGNFRNYPTVGYNANFVSITGVVRINSFSRTGANPGVKITLPVNVKTVYKYDCVMTTAASTEFATIYASGNTANVSISESVTNYNSTNMTIIFMNVILERS